jgi:hypothetical protein
VVDFLSGAQQLEAASGGWLDENLGSILLASAAIGAAVLAALVAILNQRRQLDHDRFLRNQERISDSVDDATVRLGDARIAVEKLAGNVLALERIRNGDLLTQLTPDQMLQPRAMQERRRLVSQTQDARDSALSAIIGMQEAAGRLELRFADIHPVVEVYRGLLLNLRWQHSLAEQGIGKPLKRGAEEKILELGEVFETLVREYRETCYSWFND